MPDKYNQKWVHLARIINKAPKDKGFAITIGQTTYYTSAEESVSASWRRHEDEHKSQWEKDGTIRFITKYLYEAIRYGYKDISYEQSARAAETIEKS